MEVAASNPLQDFSSDDPWIIGQVAKNGVIAPDAVVKAPRSTQE
jgi:hypothetical protein